MCVSDRCSYQTSAAFWLDFTRNVLTVINNIPAVINEISSRHDGTIAPVIMLLNLCLFLVSVIKLPESLEQKPAWTELFNATLSQIHAHRTASADYSTSATDCIAVIQSREYQAGHSSDYRSWAEWYSPEKTVFSDALVEQLADMGTHEYVQYRRQWIANAARRLAASNDG